MGPVGPWSLRGPGVVGPWWACVAVLLAVALVVRGEEEAPSLLPSAGGRSSIFPCATRPFELWGGFLEAIDEAIEFDGLRLCADDAAGEAVAVEVLVEFEVAAAAEARRVDRKGSIFVGKVFDRLAYAPLVRTGALLIFFETVMTPEHFAGLLDGATLARSRLVSLVPNNREGGFAQGVSACRLFAGAPMRAALVYASFSNPAETQDDDRIGGFLDGVASRPGCEVSVISRVEAGWSRERARDLLSFELIAKSKINVVVAANDDMALGAIDAARAFRKDGVQGVVVIGFDHVALAALNDGTLAMTVDQQWDSSVVHALQAIFRLHGDYVDERHFWVLVHQTMAATAPGWQLGAEDATNTSAILGGAVTVETAVLAFERDNAPVAFEAIIANYNRDIKPLALPGEGSAEDAGVVLERTGLRDVRITSVDESRGLFAATLLLLLEWHDHRLAWDPKVHGKALSIPVNLLYVPDVYFRNQYLKSEPFQALDALVSADGTVRLARLIKNEFLCTFRLSRYPYDAHRCEFELISTNNVSDVVLDASLGFELQNSKTSRFELRRVSQDVAICDSSSFRDQSTVKYAVHINRMQQSFLLTAFLPDMAFQLINYLGVYIHPAAAPARISISVIPVLIARTLANSVFESIPRVAYAVWLELYLTFSLILSCALVFEYALVQYFMRKEDRCEAKLRQFAKATASSLDVKRVIQLAATTKSKAHHHHRRHFRRRPPPPPAATPPPLRLAWSPERSLLGKAFSSMNSVVASTPSVPSPRRNRWADPPPFGSAMIHSAVPTHDPTSTSEKKKKKKKKMTTRETTDEEAPYDDDDDDVGGGTVDMDLDDDKTPIFTSSAKKGAAPAVDGSADVRHKEKLALEHALMIFHKFDNGDGCLELHELQRALTYFGRFYSCAQTAEIVASYLEDIGELEGTLTPAAQDGGLPTIRMRFTLFINFLFFISSYETIGLKTKDGRFSLSHMPPSRRCDEITKWLYPVVLFLKIVIFYLLFEIKSGPFA